MTMYASTFLATMAALSVAVERVVEILKQMFGTFPIIRLLFTPRRTQRAENFRCACMYLLSATVGGLIAGFGHIDILPNAHRPYFSYALAGLLSSGGSAFWNHALDLIQATKVQKEEVATTLARANAAAAALGGASGRSATATD